MGTSADSAKPRIIAFPSSAQSERTVLLQKSLRIKRRHASCARAGDGLAIDVVLNIAGCEDTRYARHRREALQSGARHDVAILHFNLALKDVRIRMVPDRDEAAL